MRHVLIAAIALMFVPAMALADHRFDSRYSSYDRGSRYDHGSYGHGSYGSRGSHSSVSLSFGFATGGFASYNNYCAYTPVYRQRVYCAPTPVVVAPSPVVYSPAPVVTYQYQPQVVYVPSAPVYYYQPVQTYVAPRSFYSVGVRYTYGR